MFEKDRITKLSASGGCASKIGPAELSSFLCGVELLSDPNLLVGLDRADDAAVYKLTEEIAIIQTLDFFSPIVEDPFTFGRIAAVNSLSDVYAMGGRPLTAMNIFCFPARTVPANIAKQIIAGGADTLNKAGCLLVGGHSVMDDGIKYGLSVTGTINPGKIKTKHGANVGDAIILTKPLGTGIISTALKADMCDESSAQDAILSMTELNKISSEIMAGFDVHACTDVTGFSLIGSLYECMLYSDFGAKITASYVPFLPKVYEYASFGLMPEGLYRNRDFYAPHVEKDCNLNDVLYHMLFDPQTSGGLLIFVENSSGLALLQELKTSGVEAALIGHVLEGVENKIHIVF